MGQLRGLFRFQNVDSTKDLNDRFAGLVLKGVMDAGATHPSGAGQVTTPYVTRVAGQLAVDVLPFMGIGSDGMVVVHDGPPTRLGLIASITQYVTVRSVYQQAGPADTAFVVFTTADWTALVPTEKAKYIVLAKVTTGISQIADDSGIDLRENDIVDRTERYFIRGVVQTNAMLPIDSPTAVKRVQNGDVYLVIDDRQLWRWNQLTSTWDTVTDQFVNTDLQFHKGVNGPPIPLTGTASLLNGNASVGGSGTLYSSQLTSGDTVNFGSDVVNYVVLNVLTNTSLTLTTPYLGTPGSKSVRKIQLNVTHGGPVIIRDAEGYPSHPAAAISFLPPGGSFISSLNVQDAINEVDQKKVKKAGDTMTGDLTMSSASIFVTAAAGSNVGITVTGGSTAAWAIDATALGNGAGIRGTSGPTTGAIGIVGRGAAGTVGTVGGYFTGGLSGGQGLIVFGDAAAAAPPSAGAAIIAKGGTGNTYGIVATGGTVGGNGVAGQGGNSDLVLTPFYTGVVGQGGQNGASYGFGVWGLGKGASVVPPDGSGVMGIGGPSGSKGGYFIGASGSGYGVRAEGGTASGDGIVGLGFGFIGGSIPVPNNVGVVGLGGTGDGPGGVFVGGTTNGAGVNAVGTGVGTGVVGTGGSTGGTGVYGQGGTAGARGGQFFGTGSNHGVDGTGGPGAPTNNFTGVVGVAGFGGNAGGSAVVGLGKGIFVGVAGYGPGATTFEIDFSTSNATKAGIVGVGGTNGTGVHGLGNGTGVGVRGRGAVGVRGEGVGANADGVQGVGTGNFSGVFGLTGGTGGAGLLGEAAHNNSHALHVRGGSNSATVGLISNIVGVFASIRGESGQGNKIARFEAPATSSATSNYADGVEIETAEGLGLSIKSVSAIDGTPRTALKVEGSTDWLHGDGGQFEGASTTLDALDSAIILSTANKWQALTFNPGQRQLGTAATTNGSPNVVGTGTFWNGTSSNITLIRVGSKLVFQNQPNAVYTVQSITNDTHLTLTTNFTGSTTSLIAVSLANELRNITFAQTYPARLDFAEFTVQHEGIYMLSYGVHIFRSGASGSAAVSLYTRAVRKRASTVSIPPNVDLPLVGSFTETKVDNADNAGGVANHYYITKTFNSYVQAGSTLQVQAAASVTGFSYQPSVSHNLTENASGSNGIQEAPSSFTIRRLF